MVARTGLHEEEMSRLKRAVFWQMTLLPAYALTCLGVVIAAGYEAAEHGPYTRSFNNRLKAKAEQSHLVGGPSRRVAVVLGSPDNTKASWDVVGPDGTPVPGAEFVVTYEYYPYPWVPFSKFQVHTTRDVVRGFEVFDD
jgi:hypothetical protein